MERKMKSYKLSEEEKAIEKEIDTLKPIAGKKREQVENILNKARKSRSISLRISNFDLEKLKEKATTEGIPYQTLINSVLHKYVTNQLFERNEVLKSIRLINKS